MGFSCFCVVLKIMKETVFLFEPRKLKTFLTSRKLFIQFVGGFCVSDYLFASHFPSLEANDFRVDFKGFRTQESFKDKKSG